MSKYEKVADEQLIRRLREGEAAITDYIINKYKYLVKMKAAEMYLLGGERDDLIQEGMIGLFKAIRDYDVTQETSFYSFAELCISRQLYTAIKNSQRQKHIPLNTYVSLYDNDEDYAAVGSHKPLPLIDTIQTEKVSNPEELFLDKEFFLLVREKLEKSLSTLESRVLRLHLQGENYRSIAKLLDKSPKSIDNALQRIKQKVFDILANV